MSHLMQFHRTHGNHSTAPISTTWNTTSCQLRLTSGTLKTKIYFLYTFKFVVSIINNSQIFLSDLFLIISNR